MFLPLGTTANNGEVRYGAIAIVVICVLVHVLVWRNLADHSSEMDSLEEQILMQQADERLNRQFEKVAGDVIPDGPNAEERQANLETVVQQIREVRSHTLQYKLSLVKGDFNPLNMITSLFTHADWMHLLFNMWFFLIVGVTMEKYWRMGRFFLVYFVSGMVGSIVFMIISREKGIPLMGASGAIAGMMGAFAVTHGDAKIKVFYLLGLKPGTFLISASWYIGFWFLGQIMDGILSADQAGGIAYSAHISGFATGWVAGKTMKPDIFYKKAYTPDFTPPDWDAFDKEQEKKKLEEESRKQDQYQDGTEITGLMEKARNALMRGEYRESGDLYYQAVERAFQIPNLAPSQMEGTLQQTLQSANAISLPPGAVYAWARRMEQREWWQWAIFLYDFAAQEPPTESNGHSRRTSYFRAASLRLDHHFESDKGRAALIAIAQSGEEDPLVTEAREKLTGLEV